MARRTNYRFERMERERKKAEKKAARAAAKQARKEGLVPDGEAENAGDLEDAPASPETDPPREP